MYYNYDEYMREVLGYPPDNRALPYEDPFQASVTYQQDYEPRQNSLTACYPDCYKMLMPMVQKACENLYDPITEDDINRMALDIYFQFEQDDDRKEEEKQENRSVEKVQATQTNSSRMAGRRFDRNLEKSISSKPITKEEMKSFENREEREERRPPRRPRNPFLFDLIKILILNQILGGIRPPHRPPMPPRPPRPPMRPREEYSEFLGNYPYSEY